MRAPSFYMKIYINGDARFARNDAKRAKSNV
jgi:hypothetical protein